MLEYLTETDPARFWSSSQSALANLGVSSVCYATILSRTEAELKGLAPSLHHRTTHPLEWIAEMERDNNFDYDLSLEDLDLFLTTPVIWHEEHKQGAQVSRSKKAVRIR